jgi:hypothetical protein
MGLLNEPISVIRNRLKSWLIYSANGSNVKELDLDLLNRANMWLQAYRQWDPLVATVTLTMVGRSAVLPTDLKSILEVYVDNMVIGKPQIWFYENDNDVAFRYTKEYTYDPATGGFWTITFPTVSPLLTTPKLKYIKMLADFTGVDIGGNPIVEYSFFPPNLLLRCAQKIFSEEKGLTGDNINAIVNSFKEELGIYEGMAQFNNQKADLSPHNKFGQPLHLNGYKMSGQQNRSGYSPYTPAQTAGLHGY